MGFVVHLGFQDRLCAARQFSPGKKYAMLASEAF
jgi:hypothetical protein